MASAIKSRPQQTVEDSASQTCQQRLGSCNDGLGPGLELGPSERFSQQEPRKDSVPVNRSDVGEIKIKGAHRRLAQPCYVGLAEWLVDSRLLSLLELMPGLHSRWRINKGPSAKYPPPHTRARLRQTDLPP